MQTTTQQINESGQVTLAARGEISSEAAMLLARARNMAFAEAARGRVSIGLSLLEDALEQEPMAYDLLSDMAALLLSAGQLAQAQAYAQKALAIVPHHGASLYTFAFARSGLGDAVQARQLLRDLLQGAALASLMDEAPDLLSVAQTELARLDKLLAHAGARAMSKRR